MELIDITVPIRTGMVTYPGDPQVTVERVSSLAAGDVANISRAELGVHTGTHVDAPLHFLDDGAGVDELALESLIGPCEVVSLPDLDAVRIATAVRDAERVLFHTPNSELWGRDSFAEDSVSLDGDGAHVLVERGVRLVGVDYLSVGDADAHLTLLGAGVVVVEGLDLRGVEPGGYELVCLPLRVVGSDGAPARAVLVRR
jgi:arylformamidase